MHYVDWTVLIIYMVISLGIGVYLKGRAQKGLSSYFLSNRSFPWWIAGTSIVATTFAADTPLAVTGFVAKNGLAGNWFWWIMGLQAMTVTFFFSRLWHRTRVLTDVEFLELRYAGKSAAFLRNFAALYRGLLLNAIKLGWVFLAMLKILDAVLGVNKEWGLWISIGIVLIYCIMSGFWGVAITDFFQFIVAMVGSIAYAIYAVKYVGGIDGLTAGLVAQYGAKGAADFLSILPPAGSSWMPMFTVVVYLGLLWWTDSRVEGGAYVAQRLMSAKNEKHAVLSALWYNYANIAARTWPWVMVALVALVVMPNAVDKEAMYPQLMATVLPVGFLGLMVTAFFAAFMSTISTLINWGASYIVNDFYKRTLAKNKSTKHYIMVSKITEALLVVVGCVVCLNANSIGKMWMVLFELSAGLGVVYMARWFWWRVNAWSEIAAMLSSGATTAVLHFYFPGLDFAHQLCIIVPVSIVIWVSVTLVTPPVPTEQLVKFYRRVRPYPLGWQPVLALVVPEERRSPDDFWKNARCWVWGVVSVYASLFAIGKWIFWQTGQAIALTMLSAATGYLIYWELTSKRARASAADAERITGAPEFATEAEQ